MSEEQQLEEKNITFYYFIGRCNPPHNGHIAILRELCTLARDSGVPALILLGSGPAGERLSFSNPLDFETKANFIRQHLSGFIEGEDYVIQEMKNSYKDVPDYVSAEVEKLDLDGIESIEVRQLAGDKGDDTRKLAGVLTAVEKKIAPILESKPGTTFSGEVIPFEPVGSLAEEKPMSATEVRKTAFDSYVKANFDLNNGFQMWPEQFKRFYGLEMYEAIVQPVVVLQTSTNDDDLTTIVEDYIHHDRLPSKKGKRKRGGSKRRTRKGGSKRRPNKTQKRRKRTTRRIR
jgi:nicotinamide mononucleotide adenylyltransferase